MATIGNSFLGLADLYKGKDGKGQVADIINMLAQTNGMLNDAIARACNSGTSHKHSVLSGLPDVAWGKLYTGIPNSKAKRTQVTDTTGFIEGLSTVDCRLAKLEPNLPAFRLQEAQAYLEAIAQEHQRALIYGDASTDPEQITGLAPRFSSLGAENGSQIIDAGGTGSDNTSIWFVTWGTDACHLIYPEGSMAGIEREDMGKRRVTDSTGAYYVMEEQFTLNTGITVRDWRKVARVANIDVSAMLADPSDIDGNGNSVYDFMRKAYHKLHGKRTVENGTPQGDVSNGNFAIGKTCVYANADVLEALDKLGTNSGANDNFIRLRPMEVQGMEIDTYRGMPVRQVDKLANDEARVV